LHPRPKLGRGTENGHVFLKKACLRLAKPALAPAQAQANALERDYVKTSSLSSSGWLKGCP